MTTATAERGRTAAMGAEATSCGRVFSPDCDIIEMQDELLLFAAGPGAKPEDIEVNFERGELTIRARVRRCQQAAEFLLHEYGVGDFYRVFRIGETIDAGGIRAEVSNGVLTIHLPKSEIAKPRQIAVRAG